MSREKERIMKDDLACQHCGEAIKWCDNPHCPRITNHLIHVSTGIGACRGNRTTALAG